MIDANDTSVSFAFFVLPSAKSYVAHIFLLHNFSELRIIALNTLIVHPVLPK